MNKKMWVEAIENDLNFAKYLLGNTAEVAKTDVGDAALTKRLVAAQESIDAALEYIKARREP